MNDQDPKSAMIKEIWTEYLKPRLPKDVISWLFALVLLLVVIVFFYTAVTGKTFMYGNGTIGFKDSEIAASIQPGMIALFSGPESQLPKGWKICDGSSVSSKTYAGLYRAIGQYWGKGDSSLDTKGNPKDFNLPDLRGRFVRGVDGGSHYDPDVSVRRPLGAGRADEVATLQGHAFQTHTHSITDPGHSHPFRPSGGDSWPNGFPSAQGVGGIHPFGTTIGPVVSAPTNITINSAEATGPGSQPSTLETRPVNVSIYFAIWIEGD